MEESTLLKELEKKENTSGLDCITILRCPLYRIVRYHSRLYYLSQNSNYQAVTGKSVFVGKRNLKLFSGYWKYIFKKEQNLFYTFNRLTYREGVYFDKFIDPVIERSFLKNTNNIIIDSPNYVGNYPRLHKKMVISNEVRSLSKQILKNLMLIITPYIFGKKTRSFFEKAKQVYELPDEYIRQYYKDVALFVAEYIYDYLWYSIIRPKRVFVVFREGYFAQIAVCKRLSIPVAEFQHGITLDRTVSFTGEYDKRIDPDYFLTFGKYWKGVNFGMPEDRVFCIGWAYSQMMKAQMKNDGNPKTTILVISSPEISDAILDSLFFLTKWVPSMKYHIRLHPSESYNKGQLDKLSQIPGAKLVDNTIDSAAVLPSYKYVIGENSSVLYEAMSMGCKVGLLNICGLCPPIDKPGIKESFSIIKNADDYQLYLSSSEKLQMNSFYSEFNNDVFEEFVKTKL